MKIARATGVDVDTLGEELILMNLDTREVVMLNDAGRLLWEALDLCATRDEVVELFQEGLSVLSRDEVASSVDAVLSKLVQSGFVVTEGPLA